MGTLEGGSRIHDIMDTSWVIYLDSDDLNRKLLGIRTRLYRRVNEDVFESVNESIKFKTIFISCK